MKTIKLGICFLDDDDTVISKRVIGTNWSVDAEQDLRENYNKYMEEETAAVLTENLKLQLTKEAVLEMIKEIRENE